MGMRFKKDAPMIKEFVSGLEKDKLECIKKELEEKGCVERDLDFQMKRS